MYQSIHISSFCTDLVLYIFSLIRRARGLFTARRPENYPAAGVVNAIEDNGGSSGSIGVFVGLLMLVGGIVSICTRNGGKGGNIALIIIFGLAALCGFAGHGNYSDLVIWSAWCLINCIMAFIALFTQRKRSDKEKA